MTRGDRGSRKLNSFCISRMTVMQERKGKVSVRYTVDREMFAVKKFSPLAQVAKILRAKISRAQTARAIFARLIFAASVGGEN